MVPNLLLLLTIWMMILSIISAKDIKPKQPHNVDMSQVQMISKQLQILDVIEKDAMKENYATQLPTSDASKSKKESKKSKGITIEDDDDDEEEEEAITEIEDAIDDDGKSIKDDEKSGKGKPIKSTEKSIEIPVSPTGKGKGKGKSKGSGKLLRY